jgi:hypothetical protein
VGCLCCYLALRAMTWMSDELCLQRQELSESWHLSSRDYESNGDGDDDEDAAANNNNDDDFGICVLNKIPVF